MSGFFTPGLPALSSANGGMPLSGSETYPVDTNKTQGQTPETGALSGQTMGAIGIGPEIALGTVAAGTITVDCTLGSFFTVTLGAVGLTLQLLNPSPGQLVEVEARQDATGSRTITTYNSRIGTATPVVVKWPAGTAPTLTTAANATDRLSFRFGGTSGGVAAYATGLASLAIA